MEAGGLCVCLGGCIARLQAPCADTFPQHWWAFTAIPLPKPEGTPLPSPLTRRLESRLHLGGKTGGIGRDLGSAVVLRGEARGAFHTGGSCPEAPRSWCGWRRGRKEPADRRCLSSSWKEEAGRRGMHLVLRCVCVKQLLEQRGAVCLLSGGALLSEPRWLLDVNCSFAEWLKCMKEIRWGEDGDGVFFFLSITLRRMFSVRIDGHDSMLREGRGESLAFVNHWFKEVLVSAGIVLSCRAEGIFWGTWGQALAQDRESNEFHRLLKITWSA